MMGNAMSTDLIVHQKSGALTRVKAVVRVNRRAPEMHGLTREGNDFLLAWMEDIGAEEIAIQLVSIPVDGGFLYEMHAFVIDVPGWIARGPIGET